MRKVVWLVVAACSPASAGTGADPSRASEVLPLPSLGISVTVPAGTQSQTAPDGSVSLRLGVLHQIRLSRLSEKPTFADAVAGFVHGGGAQSVHADVFGDNDYTIEGSQGYGQRTFYRVLTFHRVATYACDAQFQDSDNGAELAVARGVCESVALSSPR